MSTSTTIAPPQTQQSSELSDLVDVYAVSQNLPSTDWITRLHLERPRRDIRCLNRSLKRTFDLVVASTMIVLLAPVMAFVAVLVRLSSPGPVVFRQVRTGLNLRKQTNERRETQRRDTSPYTCDRRSQEDEGLEAGTDRRAKRSDRRMWGSDRRKDSYNRRQDVAFGKPFVLYKFRTMCIDAEKHGAQLAVKGDSRITPICRCLRKTRLDELPQLWNVIRGEMSLVGPRPERPEFIEQLSEEIPDYLQRLGLQPGLTGVAQVINGYDDSLASFRRKVALDLLYLQNCCFQNDVKILLRTVTVVLTGKGVL